jgi:hypothetical protein
MQTGDLLWALLMILNCLTEHFLVVWEPQHNPRPVKPVHFPLAAAHHPPSQGEEISGFLNSLHTN